MINIETNIIDIDNWKVGIIDLLGFDDTLATQQLLPQEVENDYVSYDMYLIDKYDSPSISPYIAVTSILGEIKELYDLRGQFSSYKLEPATDNTYIAVFAYQI